MLKNRTRKYQTGLLWQIVLLLLICPEILSAKTPEFSFSLNYKPNVQPSLNSFHTQHSTFVSPRSSDSFPDSGILMGKYQNDLFKDYPSGFSPFIISTESGSSSESESGSSTLEEIGYILAMETVFTGMSYLASREEGSGPAIAGGFDVLIGLAGIPNATIQDSNAKKAGYFLISAGFIAKSLYNFHYGENHDTKTRFLTNFIGFNVLVFTGYYLDTL